MINVHATSTRSNLYADLMQGHTCHVCFIKNTIYIFQKYKDTKLLADHQAFTSSRLYLPVFREHLFALVLILIMSLVVVEDTGKQHWHFGMRAEQRPFKNVQVDRFVLQRGIHSGQSKVYHYELCLGCGRKKEKNNNNNRSAANLGESQTSPFYILAFSTRTINVTNIRRNRNSDCSAIEDRLPSASLLQADPFESVLSSMFDVVRSPWMICFECSRATSVPNPRPTKSNR